RRDRRVGRARRADRRRHAAAVAQRPPRGHSVHPAGPQERPALGAAARHGRAGPRALAPERRAAVEPAGPVDRRLPHPCRARRQGAPPAPGKGGPPPPRPPPAARAGRGRAGPRVAGADLFTDDTDMVTVPETSGRRAGGRRLLPRALLLGLIALAVAAA